MISDPVTLAPGTATRVTLILARSCIVQGVAVVWSPAELSAASCVMLESFTVNNAPRFLSPGSKIAITIFGGMLGRAEAMRGGDRIDLELRNLGEAPFQFHVEVPELPLIPEVPKPVSQEVRAAQAKAARSVKDWLQRQEEKRRAERRRAWEERRRSWGRWRGQSIEKARAHDRRRHLAKCKRRARNKANRVLVQR